MPRKQSRNAQRARARQKASGGKYTALLREAAGGAAPPGVPGNPPAGPRTEHSLAAPTRRLIYHLRTEQGPSGRTTAHNLDRALNWALSDRASSYGRSPGADPTEPPSVPSWALKPLVHDAPLVQAVVEVLETAAYGEASAELLRAAADVFTELHDDFYEWSGAVLGVGEIQELTSAPPRHLGDIIDGQAIALAEAALRCMREAARIVGKGDPVNLDSWILLEQVPPLIHLAAHLVAHPDTYSRDDRQPALLR